MCTHYQRLALIVILAFCFRSADLSAQQIKLMRYDEDYSNLSDSARNLYNTLKFLPLTQDKKSYLSLGGEIRGEYGGKLNEDWIKDQGYNFSILQRYVFYTDLHVGEKLRFFAQLNSALENGSKYGPSPVDEDQLAVQNLFAEVQLFKSPKASLSVRAGRQEINYGSGRLISVRELSLIHI